MSDAPNTGEWLYSNPPAEPAGSPAPGDADRAEREAVDREVADAMSQMSVEDLADLTMTPEPAAARHEPAAGVQLGRIVAVRGDDVFVDLGGKRQGVIPRTQFGADEKLAAGEPVEVVIDRYDRGSDLLILSRRGAVRSTDWDMLRPGDLVEGRIIGLNKGGLEIQLKGIKAFMPASHVDVMHVKDISIFLNETVKCQVMEIDRRGKSLTVSRRRVLEKERAAKREQLLSELEVGQTRKGVVGNLAEFGAFVDLGGVDGLIHISDMSWRQIANPSEVVKTGDVVDVKVLKIQDEDGGKKRISLGLKQAQPDPWSTVSATFPVNTTHRVRVLRLAAFGAFAELAEGIEGLIPISEMAWQRINQPSEVVEVGQVVDAVVIRVEPDKRRIALSMKQAQSDPWKEVLDSYQPDTMVDGKITKLVDFGAFVELAPGVEGLIHISELSDRRVRSCAEVVKAGQEVKARVLSVDAPNRRISLSLKPAHTVPVAETAAAAGPGAPSPAAKKREKPRRGGLAAGWDWTGGGLDQLARLAHPAEERSDRA